MGQDTDEIREEIERTRERMSDTVDAIAYKADVPSRVHDAVSDKVDAVKSSITGAIGDVRDRVSDVRHRVGDAMPDSGDVRAATTNAVNVVRENPLGMLFGAAAIGFLIGSLVPSTTIENERLGEIGDHVKQTAQATGGQLLEQGKAVVRETLDAAQQSAMQHGQEVAKTATQGMQSASGRDS